MRSLIPWVLLILALVMLRVGWWWMARDIEANVTQLGERYETMSDEQVAEDVMLRMGRLAGDEPTQAEIDQVLLDVEDTGVRARARTRMAAREMATVPASVADDAQPPTPWFLVVGLGLLLALIVGGVVGAVLVLRQGDGDEGPSPS